MKVTVTHDDGNTWDITEGVQILYDLLGASMDYGSGFLDTNEVAKIRGLGMACGFKPLSPYAGDACVGCGHERQSHNTYGAGTGCFKRVPEDAGGVHKAQYNDWATYCPCMAFIEPPTVVPVS
jgi:hypothetical protein